MGNNSIQKSEKEQLKECKELEGQLRTEVTQLKHEKEEKIGEINEALKQIEDLRNIREKKTCVAHILMAFGIAAFVILVLAVIFVFCSSKLFIFYPEFNAYLFLYGAIIAVSLTVLLIYICNLLVKIWVKKEEE